MNYKKTSLLLALAALILISACDKDQLIKKNETLSLNKSKENITSNVSEPKEDYEEFELDLSKNMIYNGTVIDWNKFGGNNALKVLIILKEENIEVQNRVVEYLEKYGFELESYSFVGKWIAGNVTKNILQKIISNREIQFIRVPLKDEITKIDPAIFEEFRVKEWVNAVITLKDGSNVSINNELSLDEIRKLLLEQDRQNLVIQSTLIANLSDLEFKIRSKSLSGGGFSGEISSKGLVKLAKDSRVLSIRKPIIGVAG